MVFKNKSKKLFLLHFLFYFFIFLLLFRLVKSIKDSLFFNLKDRINIVFYEETPVFISIGRKDSVHYLIRFEPEMKVYVPGGYQYYRIGSLGKLAYLEKKTEIVEKTFSSSLSCFVDFYFLKDSPTVYFNKNNSQSYIFNKKIKFDHLFLINFKSNTNFFDRLWLMFFFISKRKIDFSIINLAPFLDKKNDFNEKDFFDYYQGHFYHSNYRKEGKTVQIIYQDYSIAKRLGRIIEGEGIRIVDFTKTSVSLKSCILVENSETASQTGEFLAKKLNCLWKKGKPTLSDIQIFLGDHLENIWQ